MRHRSVLCGKDALGSNLANIKHTTMKKLFAFCFSAAALMTALPLDAQRSTIPNGRIIEEVFKDGKLESIDCEMLGGGCLEPVTVR